ncbi:hypothetical protein [Pseudorhodoferax sp.]|uniref:hypothetical protein n=1 Tax=Pseudorhodoferax sp. TaxID=1993553 RepID=UPI0039E65EFD
MSKPFRLLACASVMALGAQPAWAHGYELAGRCEPQGARVVRCTAGIDGRPVPGARIDVVAADGDAILLGGRLDGQGRFSFERPAVPFYVVIEAKPGIALDIGDEEIK